MQRERSIGARTSAQTGKSLPIPGENGNRKKPLNVIWCQLNINSHSLIQRISSLYHVPSLSVNCYIVLWPFPYYQREIHVLTNNRFTVGREMDSPGNSLATLSTDLLLISTLSSLLLQETKSEIYDVRNRLWASDVLYISINWFNSCKAYVITH